MKMRHEYKHRLNAMDYTVLSSRIRAVLCRDSHTNERGKYRVRSLYFDTPNDRALREKISGTDRREKFRIRRYPGGPERVSLEKKIKVKGLCAKKSEILTPDECERIIRGDIDWMIGDNRPLLVEFYSKIRGQLLRPKVIVEYVREPFVYAAGNVRITFDCGIRTGSMFRAFPHDDMPLIPAGDEIVLLEVKYDAYLPDFIANLIQVDNRRAAACSKYAIARMYG
jgi:hypothetical protein